MANELDDLEQALASETESFRATKQLLPEEVCGNLKDKEPALLTRERHRRHAAGCLVALDAFLEAQGSMPIELAAEELRVAARELGRVVGAIDVEEVLDVLFRDFCIGK